MLDMNTQIPLYRAKKIDSDEWVIGFLSHRSKGIFVIKGFPIDPSTLAIHFPDMLDSEDNKIFASLSEDGKGGDRLKHQTNKDVGLNGTVIICSNGRLSINDGMLPKWRRLKVTGIQK